MENLNDLLTMKLNALLFIEQEIVKALPKMVQAATDPDLKKAFEGHLKETELQVQRLNQAIELMDMTPEPLESDAILGMVKDAEWTISNMKQPEILDAALIANAQYVEHLEMAGYGSAISWAEQLGEKEVQTLLQESLNEEKLADEKLSGLAEQKINLMAMDEEGQEFGRTSTLGKKMQTGNI